MAMVSVIVPNYNHSLYLNERIDSILNQTFQDFELIILDDCSTDNSKAVIKTYRNHPKVSQVVFNENNSGSPFKQWVKGIDMSLGKYIWIAESDDYANSTFLEVLIATITKYSNVGIAFCGSHWVDSNGKVEKDLSIYFSSFYKDGRDEIKNVLSKYCSIQNVSSSIFRRDLAKQCVIGLEKYKACGDWIFYTRLLSHANLAFESSKLNYFRWYHNNISNSANKQGIWVEEGVDVLKNINYGAITFTLKEFYFIIRLWSKKANSLSRKKKIAVYFKLIFIVRLYLSQRMRLRFKTI